jgi:uncharacterized protein YbbC (DUF1343 family)
MKYPLLIILLSIVFGCTSNTARSADNGAGTHDGHATEIASLRTGAEVLVADEFGLLAGRKIGLITNHTATVGNRHLADLMHESDLVELVALFGPEHGIRGDAPAGDRIDFSIDEATGLPVHSLYGATLKPTPEMLEGIEVLVFDIQDIGPRFYTYISTMGKGMEAAAENGLTFVVLDRPNPLGGVLVEGPVREDGFESFVGYYPIPITHGLTVGELALMIRGEAMLPGLEDLDLQIVSMEGWNRQTLWPDLGRDWNPPSPNIPNFETALIYPGACLFEGLSASEGRGTFEPFLVVGAPWADGAAIAADLNSRELPGLRFEAVTFTPESIPNMATRPKHLGTELQGVRHIITDAALVRPVEAGIYVVHAFWHNTPEADRGEFFNDRWFGRLAGTNRIHEMIRAGDDPTAIISSWYVELASFKEARQPYLLYP